MKDPQLIKKYKEFYEKIRTLANDAELFPIMTDAQFQEFVSPRDWMGVPSFSISKKEMTNSDMGHLAIWMDGERKMIDLWFNGIRAVERFCNLLSPYSQREHKEFISLIKSLDSRYQIEVSYSEKFYAGSANWQPVIKLKCNSLNDKTIESLLETIKQTKEKRDYRQKELKNEENGKSKVATIAVSLAEIELDLNNDEDLKQIIKNVSELTRLCYRIKSSRAIKNIEPILKDLETRKLRIEKGLDPDATQEEYDNIINEIKLLRGK